MGDELDEKGIGSGLYLFGVGIVFAGGWGGTPMVECDCAHNRIFALHFDFTVV
mgnify:CR=1